MMFFIFISLVIDIYIILYIKRLKIENNKKKSQENLAHFIERK